MGIIYKICCNFTNEVYFGKTKHEMNVRKTAHLSKGSKCISTQIISRGNFTFAILEENVENEILAEREHYYITNFDCINKNRPYVGNDDKGHRNNEYMKKRYADNKELYVEKSKQNYESKKDIINEKKREKYTCECGAEPFNKGNLWRHLKSPYHLKYIDNNV
jgi:hypothetical protein